MLKLMCILMVMLFSFIVGIAVMINGWGLEIQSWGWVIGGGIWTLISLLILTVIED